MLLKTFAALNRVRRRSQDVGQMAVIIAVMAGIAFAIGSAFKPQITQFIQKLFDSINAQW